MPGQKIDCANTLKHYLSLFSNVVLLYVLAACQGTQANFIATFIPATTDSTAQPSATATRQATPIILTPPDTPEVNLPVASSTSTPTELPGGIDFFQPTETPIPVASWRPPLYPDPWAPTIYDHFYFSSPFAANEVNDGVSAYRYGGVFFEAVVHTGVDIPAPKGTPILAVGPGTVIWAGYGVFQGGYDPKDPYGLAVTIRHDFGYQNHALFTVYGHMSEVDVVEGQHVETGQVLGLVGETGRVTGPHLHLEVRIDENSFFTTRNPELWIVPPIGWGIVAGRMMDSADRLVYDQQLIITNPQTQQNWFAWSYGKTAVNSDPYYQENLVIGDLPEGKYVLRTAFGGMNFTAPIEVHGGVVNYFYFHGYQGFSVEPPVAPGADFTPAPISNPIP